MNSYLGPLLLLISSAIWSIDLLVRYPLIQVVDSGTVVYFEHIFALLILFPLFLKRKTIFRKLNQKEWGALFFIGFLGSGIATLFLTASYRFLNPSVAILLQKIQPIITIIGARIILKEKYSSTFYIWMLVSIIGATFLAKPEISNTSLSDTRWIGLLLALFASFAWGLSTVFGKLLGHKLDFYSLTYGRYLFGFLGLLLLSLLSYIFINPEHSLLILGMNSASLSKAQNLFISSQEIRNSFLYIGLISGTFAMLIYYAGLVRTQAAKAALYELFFPFFSVIINWIFLKQELTAIQVVGGMFLLISAHKTYQIKIENK